jgi:hypothetical protein
VHGGADHVEMAVGDGIERSGKKRGARHSRGLARTQTNRKAASNPMPFWLDRA